EFLGRDAAHDAYAVRLEPEGGGATTVYLDEKSFLPQSEESSGPLGGRTITFAAWRAFAGILFPGTIHQSNGDARFDVTMTTSDVGINESLDAALFEKPNEAA